ncbi:hypothetical protein FHL15_007959 [Xylaria flabelliformis]|uniref:Uncharacterized protein n=1 Tax=Xylaria flabelliformis TaxID=2512241 RepID=A0A553HTA9_9PEZI|nr:hypothetical protein FHL15_007959 [Xylaria flabelliformis]
MSTTPAGPLRKAWHVWKSLRLPWRKRFFVGQDPQGNTYYELRQPRGDAPATAAYRRLVHYPRSTPYSEVKVPPAWHQWLRHQRPDPPTMQEQIAELQRQARIKVLAAEADARWEAKDSLLDMPGKKSVGEIGPGKTGKVKGEEARKEVGEGVKEDTQKPDPDPDPWKQAAQRGAPGETWQPEAWAPAPAKKR